MTTASFLLAWAGMALLALAMRRNTPQFGLSRHWRERCHVLRRAGALLLGGSLLARIGGPDWRVGIVEWIGQLALCAATVTVLATYRPRMVRMLVAPAVTAAVLALLSQQVRG